MKRRSRKREPAGRPRSGGATRIRRLSGSGDPREGLSRSTAGWTIVVRPAVATLIPNPGQARRKASGSTAACFRIARSVPSGMSPGWFGTVVYRFVLGLYQIS
jgi:hypothetical protein